MDGIVALLTFAAVILALVDLLRSRGQSLTAWAVLALGIAGLVTLGAIHL